MNAVVLDQGLILYQKDPPKGGIEGLNFLAVVDGERALFVDTGYAEDMRFALADLEERRVHPVGAVISHYDPDHYGGLELLGRIETWGGARWSESVARWRSRGGRAPAEPTHIVSSPEDVQFGRHLLRLCSVPGHTTDSLVAVIDDEWLYVADSVLFTNDGRPLLPSIHARPVSLHLDAIDWLAERADLVFVPGHGAVLRDRATRERDLANRRRYLSALCAAARPISFEEATAGCEPPFLGREWHEENYR